MKIKCSKECKSNKLRKLKKLGQSKFNEVGQSKLIEH